MPLPSIHNIQNLNSSSDSCNNFSISTSSENHALLETPSIEKQLEMGNSSYEVKENDKVHVVKNNISESKLDPTSTVDQVAITNNNNNLSSQSKVINTHTNSNVSQKQHQNVLQIEDNPLLLSTNSLGDSSTSKSSNHNHNKPLVQCNIQGLKFNALLDACSTGPEGYIVNYIHPDVVQQIKNHQSKIKPHSSKNAIAREHPPVQEQDVSKPQHALP